MGMTGGVRGDAASMDRVGGSWGDYLLGRGTLVEKVVLWGTLAFSYEGCVISKVDTSVT